MEEAKAPVAPIIEPPAKKEVAKAELPLLGTRLNRLVAFQELSFTGIPPTPGLAGIQCTNFLYDVQALGALPETAKIAS